MKECVLYDRKCTGCGECELCDLDPKKHCDNCGKCLETGQDYRKIDIDGVDLSGEAYERWVKEQGES